MTDKDQWRAPGRQAGADACGNGADFSAGLARGTRVLTLEGALPVEYLSPGDRVITRDGARVLRGVRAGRVSGQMVRLRAGVLGLDRPEGELLLAPGTGVLIRDWRALALYGAKQAVVPVRRLIDGDYIAAVPVQDLPVYALEFDRPQVIYAEGIEIEALPALVAAR